MTGSIIALQCPVCGAPFQRDSDRCGYCGSILALKANHPRIDPKLLNKSVIDQHIAEYRRTLRTDPNDETAHYGLGVAYFSLGLSEDSIRQLTRAAELMPENPNIQTQLAVALRDAAREGNAHANEQMHRRINMALRLDRSNLEAVELLIDAALESDDLSGVIERVEHAYAIAPDLLRNRFTDTLIESSKEQRQNGKMGLLYHTLDILLTINDEPFGWKPSHFLARTRNIYPSACQETTPTIALFYL